MPELERRLPLRVGELHHLEADARADRLRRRRAQADHAAAVQGAGAAAQADDLGVVVEADVGAVVAQVGELEGAAVPVDARVRARDAVVVDDVGRLRAAAEDHRQAGAGVDAVQVEPDQADAFGLGDRQQHVAVGRRRGVAEAAHRLQQVHVHRLDAAAQLHPVEAAKARALPVRRGRSTTLAVARVSLSPAWSSRRAATLTASPKTSPDISTTSPWASADLQLERDTAWRAARAVASPLSSSAARRPCRCAPASRASRRRRRRLPTASRTPPSGRRRAS